MNKGLQQTFLHRRHTNGQEVYEKVLNIVIREMQIKHKTSYHLTPVRMAVIKGTSVGEDLEELEPFQHCWERKMVQQL